MPLLLDMLRLLMSGYRHVFRPSLEHAAALVTVSAAQHGRWGRAARCTERAPHGRS